MFDTSLVKTDAFDGAKEEYLDLAPITYSVGEIPRLRLVMTRIRVAESRQWESQHVVPQTYKTLDYIMNACYRDCKQNINSLMSYEIKVDKVLRRLESDYTIEYAKNLEAEGKTKKFEAKIYRDAFLETKPEYVSCREQQAKVKVLIDWYEGKIKVMEKTCSMMRKAMDMHSKMNNFNPGGG